MSEQVCFRTLEFDQPWTLENYRKVGGYSVWEKILKEKTPPAQIGPAARKSNMSYRNRVKARDGY